MMGSMKNLTRKIIALFLSVVAVFSVINPSAVQASVVSTSRTTCAGTEGYGVRVCVDQTTPYGAQVYVYQNGGTYYTARANVTGGSLVAAFDATGANVVAPGTSPSSFPYAYVTGVPAPSQVSTVYIEWLNSNSPYDTFTLVNNSNIVVNSKPSPNNVFGVWTGIWRSLNANHVFLVAS